MVPSSEWGGRVRCALMTFATLWANSVDGKLMIFFLFSCLFFFFFFFFFFRNIGLDISCKFSPCIMLYIHSRYTRPTKTAFTHYIESPSRTRPDLYDTYRWWSESGQFGYCREFLHNLVWIWAVRQRPGISVQSWIWAVPVRQLSHKFPYNLVIIWAV